MDSLLHFTLIFHEFQGRQEVEVAAIQISVGGRRRSQQAVGRMMIMLMVRLYHSSVFSLQNI